MDDGTISRYSPAEAEFRAEMESAITKMGTQVAYCEYKFGSWVVLIIYNKCFENKFRFKLFIWTRKSNDFVSLPDNVLSMIDNMTHKTNYIHTNDIQIHCNYIGNTGKNTWDMQSLTITLKEILNDD